MGCEGDSLRACGQVCEEESALKYASLFGYFLGAKK